MNRRISFPLPEHGTWRHYHWMGEENPRSTYHNAAVDEKQEYEKTMSNNVTIWNIRLKNTAVIV